MSENNMLVISPKPESRTHIEHSVRWIITGGTVGFELECNHPADEGQCEVAEYISSDYSCDEFVEGYDGPDDYPLVPGKITFNIDEEGIYWRFVADVSDTEDK